MSDDRSGLGTPLTVNRLLIAAIPPLVVNERRSPRGSEGRWSSLIITTLCMSQRALRIIYFTAAALGACGINHVITQKGIKKNKKNPKKRNISGFFCTEPNWAGEQNRLIRAMALMRLISQRVVCADSPQPSPSSTIHSLHLSLAVVSLAPPEPPGG